MFVAKAFFVRLAERRVKFAGGKRCQCLRLPHSRQCVRAWRSMARCSTVQQGATRRRREVPMHCRDPAGPGGWPCGYHSFWVRTAEHRVKLAAVPVPALAPLACVLAMAPPGVAERGGGGYAAGCRDRMDPGGRPCGSHCFWVRTAERRVKIAEESSVSVCARTTRKCACHGAAWRRPIVACGTRRRVRSWLQG